MITEYKDWTKLTKQDYLDPVHTSTVARFGPVRHDKISNVNIPLIEPNRTLPNRTSPLDTTELARYGSVITGTAHQSFI